MLRYTKACVWYLQSQILHLDQYSIPENLNNRRVALFSGYGQRRPSVIRRLVDVRARLAQRPHYRLVALLESAHSSGVTPLSYAL